MGHVAKQLKLGRSKGRKAGSSGHFHLHTKVVDIFKSQIKAQQPCNVKF